MTCQPRVVWLLKTKFQLQSCDVRSLKWKFQFELGDCRLSCRYQLDCCFIWSYTVSLWCRMYNLHLTISLLLTLIPSVRYKGKAHPQCVKGADVLFTFLLLACCWFFSPITPLRLGARAGGFARAPQQHFPENNRFSSETWSPE